MSQATPPHRPRRPHTACLPGATALALAVLLAACATPPASAPTPPVQVHPTPAAQASAAASAPVSVPRTATGVGVLVQPLLPVVAASAPEPVASASLVAAAPAAVAASAPQPVDPLAPEREVVPTDAATHTDLWTRIRQGYALPTHDDETVRKWERYYAERPDYVQRMAERGERYLFHVVEEVDKRGMPTELALLPFIESAFNPQARSGAKASGIWQFMPATGRDFDLRQNLFRDERHSVLDSTRAALDYLQQLHDRFGDWHLALAAYNWGMGNVQRAIDRNAGAGLPTDYASLRMPAETRDYVPKLQAVMNIVRDPAAFDLALPELANHPYFLTVPVEHDIDVELAARLADVSLEEFRYLNPQLRKPVILAAGTEMLLLPYDNANLYAQNLQGYRGQLASWTAWVAPRTMRTADAAKQVGTSEHTLREINGIPPRMQVRAGSTLLVPRSAGRQSDVAAYIADNAAMRLTPDVPPVRRVVLRASKRGESVASVAKRYRLSATRVAQWNRLSAKGRFKPRQQIVLYLPQRSKASTRTASSKTKAGGGRSTSTTSRSTQLAKR